MLHRLRMPAASAEDGAAGSERADDRIPSRQRGCDAATRPDRGTIAKSQMPFGPGSSGVRVRGQLRVQGKRDVQVSHARHRAVLDRQFYNLVLLSRPTDGARAWDRGGTEARLCGIGLPALRRQPLWADLVSRKILGGSICFPALLQRRCAQTRIDLLLRRCCKQTSSEPPDQ
jgi:hypothetical protein